MWKAWLDKLKLKQYIQENCDIITGLNENICGKHWNTLRLVKAVSAETPAMRMRVQKQNPWISIRNPCS